jgi:cysteinyl-tRNA synthetase
MIEVKSALEKIESFLGKIKSPSFTKASANKEISKLLAETKANFYNELADNFNTPKAFAVLFDFIKDANKILDEGSIKKSDAQKAYKFFEEINEIFGIIDFKKINAKIPAKVKKLANEREKFRKEQNWQKSDELRAQIEKQGFTVEDTKQGPALKKI